MRMPPIDRIVASVSRPYGEVPYEWEYQLWYVIPAFPVLVKLRAA